MGKIKFLSDMLCNRIAAGEVIDRPYSAVKELIENSIDAGATRIEIKIERGGKDLIEVTDNGCGIEKDDMRAAFFSHATSKIRELEDIEHIRTLGFRGEALATIASISCVELVSAVEGEEGNKVECDGEFVGKVVPAVSPKGTRISIRKFFFNTPARYKFMKSDKREETYITNYITRYILGYPDISFKYIADGKLKLQSYGGGLEEAIAQVYGASALSNCFKIKAERNDIKLSGFISNQHYFKPNKTYQNVYLNGRHIENYLISSAIQNAYRAYSMNKQYPFYVLNITVPDETVDVNVHPNKADVRFTDEKLVYGSVYKVISSILDGSAQAAEFVVNGNEAEKSPANVPPVYSAEFISEQKVYDKDFSDVVGIERFTKDKKQPQPKAENAPDLSVYENYEAPDVDADPEKDLPLYSYYSPREGDKVENTFKLRSDDGFDPILASIEEEKARIKAEQEKLKFIQYNYRGVLFNTYLIYEQGDDAYLIDQHAAHERLIYDRLKTEISERTLTRQDMLVPYVFTVNPEEKQFIEDNSTLILQMGFEITPFGQNAFRVSSMPANLPSLNLKNFFEELLANVNELKKITLSDVLKDKIAQSACKHAVKGGEILTEKERDGLFEMLKGNLGLKCPHGRPVCVRISKAEIEKIFKRKV